MNVCATNEGGGIGKFRRFGPEIGCHGNVCRASDRKTNVGLNIHSHTSTNPENIHVGQLPSYFIHTKRGGGRLNIHEETFTSIGVG